MGKKSRTRSAGKAAPPADASSLLERTFQPGIADIQELAQDIQAGTLMPEAVFGKVLEIYQAFYAAGRFGEILIAQLGDLLQEDTRAALLKTAREVADHQVELFRKELIG